MAEYTPLSEEELALLAHASQLSADAAKESVGDAGDYVPGSLGHAKAMTRAQIDAAFLAASREAVPRLIAELRRAWAERDAARAALAVYADPDNWTEEWVMDYGWVKHLSGIPHEQDPWQAARDALPPA